MNMSMGEIERITAEKLRGLPLCDEDLYDMEHLEVLEEEDDLPAADSGFMHGYLQED